MKKILVPTDFSHCADEATRAAMELAQVTNGEVDYIHIMDIPHDWIMLQERDQDVMYPDVTKKVKVAHQELDERVMATEKIGLIGKKYLIFNEDTKYISKLAADHQYDYIVMGSNGVSGFREMIIGSNTQKVVKTSTVPVLVIKDFPVNWDCGRIVFMSDFDIKGLAGFKKLISVAQSTKLKVHLLLVNTPNTFMTTEDSLSRMSIFKDYGKGMVEGCTIYNATNYQEGLTKFLDQNSDILGMVTHRSNNRLAQHIVNHLSVPMLNVHIS